MKTSRPLLLTLFTLLAPLCWAAPASAGTVYVPLATNSDIAGSRFRSAVWVVNTGAATANVQAVFLESGADGRTRTSSTPSLSLQVAPGATALITPIAPDGRTGMLEITGPNSLVVEARLSNGGLGAPLPVVSSSNLMPAGETAQLLALERDRERFTNIGLLNLGQAAARCTARVMQSDGRALGGDIQITLPPLSHRQYNDPLPAFGTTAITSGRTSITCDQQFFVYSATFRQGAGEVAFGGPSPALDSELTSAGVGLVGDQVDTEQMEEAGDVDVVESGDAADLATEADLESAGSAALAPRASCGAPRAGVHCFDQRGVFFVPTRSAPTKRIILPFANKVEYKKVRVQIAVTHGGWFAKRPDGIHNIFWIAQGTNPDRIGYVNFRGPKRNLVYAVHHIGAPKQIEGRRLSRTMAVHPGQTYLIDYTFDAQNHHVEFVVSDVQGRQLMRSTDNTTFTRRIFTTKYQYLIDFGLHDEAADAPTFNWQYADLKVEFFQ